jgi:GH24 family phage-related lysozyme (muramidase)
MNLKAKYKKQLLIGGGILLLLLLSKKAKAPMLTLLENKIKEFLPPLESFRATPYWDNKQWSWGFGTRVPGSVNDPNVRPNKTITREQAEKDMLAHAENDYLYLERLINVALTVNQWTAYLSFAYNLGPGMPTTWYKILMQGTGQP